MAELFNPPQWARDARPAAVAGTGSSAPARYTPIADTDPVFDVVSHGAQYGLPRRYGHDRIGPTLIVWHTTEEPDLWDSLVYDMRRPESVGQTAMLGPHWEHGDAVLAVTNPDTARSWTQGRWSDGALSVEVCGRASWTRAEWLALVPGLVPAAVRLLVHWCRRWNIPPVWLTPEQIADGASRSGGSPWVPMGRHRGICDHDAANKAAISLGHDPGKYSHHDVGAGLRSILIGDVLPAVDAILNPPPPPPPTPGDEMVDFILLDGDTAQYARQGMFVRWMPDGAAKKAFADELGIPDTDRPPKVVTRAQLRHYILVGPHPQYDTRPPQSTSVADFGGNIA